MAPSPHASSKNDDLDPLIEHAGYLRRIARALLRGRGWEDDVVQQAWMAALNRPPGSIRSPRVWLAGAVRHLSRRKIREEERRTRREHAASVPERTAPRPLPSARVEALRSVLDAVDTLANPYRDAIVRRYLEDQTPAEIAAADGVAESTVRVWIHRGLRQLREDLDPGDDNARRAFVVALAPTAGISTGVVSATTAGIASQAFAPTTTPTLWAQYGWWIMNGKALLSVAAVAVIGVSIWIWKDPARTGISSAAEAHSDRDELKAPQSPGATTNRAQRDTTRSAVATLDTSSTSLEWVLEGLCVDPDGAPVAGVPVSLRQLEGIVFAYGGPPDPVEIQLHETVSATDGSFRWPLPTPIGPTTIDISSKSDRFYARKKMPYFLEGAPPTPIRWVVHELNASVTGLVRDSNDRPIPNAHVNALGESGKTDSTGRFSLSFPSGIDPNWCSLSTHADGFAAQTGSFQPPKPGESATVNVTLLPELRVRGVVRDEDGQPIEGAVVSWFDIRTRTDIEGRYELGHLPAGQAFQPTIDAKKTGFLLKATSVPESDPEPDGTSRCDITLARGHRAHGVVTDQAGTKLHGAQVCFYDDGSGPGLRTTLTDTNGEFVVQVSSGRHQVVTTLSPLAADRRKVDIAENSTDQPGLQITLTEGHFVGGRVVDENGAPIEGARASLGRGSYSSTHVFATTDANGRFRAEGLAPGPNPITVTAAGHARLDDKVEQLDTEHYQWTLRRSAKIAGRVVDGRSGLPLKSFQIRMIWKEPAEGERGLNGLSSIWLEGVHFQSEDGYFDTGDQLFEVGAIAHLQAMAEGYGPSEAVRTVVMSDSERIPTTLQIVPAVAVRGRVVRADTDAPIAGARVREYEQKGYIQFMDPLSKTTVITNDDGTFEMHRAAGPVTLRVDTKDGRTHLDDPFVVPEDGILPERVIRIGAFGWIEGSLLDGSGSALANQKILLRSFSFGEMNTWETQTNGAGTFRFDDLNNGAYLLSHVIQTEGKEANGHTQRTMVRGGEGTHVVMKPSGTAIVRGSIQWDQPIPHLLRVTAAVKGRPGWNGEGEGVTSRTAFAIDGQFEIDGLHAGDWEVETYTWKDERLYVADFEITVAERETKTGQLTLEERID